MGRGGMGGSPPGGSGGGRGEWAAEEVAEWAVDRARTVQVVGDCTAQSEGSSQKALLISN